MASAAPVDLFLSYNRLDGPTVDRLRGHLQQQGLSTFIDYDSLNPGRPWPQALEDALTSARGVAVFLGPNGLGGWQRREMFFALDLQVAAQKRNEAFPVIPVLLAGADPTPSFLMLNSWIDVRDNEALGVEALVKALAGQRRSGVDPVALAALRPYVRLHAFREEDSAFFFGRSVFVDQLYERLGQQNVVIAIGASGSGKSSAVFAGLAPRLRRDRPPKRAWEIASFAPGQYPWRRLADALAPMAEKNAGEMEEDLKRGPSALASAVETVLAKSRGSDRLLLIIDQFEEFFTLTPAADQVKFLNSLFEVLQGSPVSVVMTLRADFYGHALEIPQMTGLLGHAVPIGPLSPSDLRDVIALPAAKAGVGFEPGLVDIIIDDVLHQPAPLPLLQYALTETWERTIETAVPNEPVTIKLDAYQKSGMLAGAIALRADQVFDSLNDQERGAARRLFGLLVHAASDTRRRARRSELDDEAWGVARRFADKDYRLLVISNPVATEEATVEVAHEAIIQHWGKLKTWVSEDRASNAVEHQVSDARILWVQNKRDDEYLLEGAALSAAHAWADQQWRKLNQQTLEFLVRSFVFSDLPLDRWIPRYAEKGGDAVALGAELLASPKPVNRGLGLDVLRWAPGAAASCLIGAAVGDPDTDLRRRSVEVLAGRHEIPLLREELAREPRGSRQECLFRALGHARNVQGTGEEAFAGLKGATLRRAQYQGIIDLLSIHRAAFALSFALASLFFHFGSTIPSRLLFTVEALFQIAAAGGAFGQLAFVLTLTMGLFALLRAIIDHRPPSRMYLFKMGLLAGFVSELVSLLLRLIETALIWAFALLNTGRQSPINFLFVFTDQLPIMLSMGIAALGVSTAATMPAGALLHRRFLQVAFSAAAVATALTWLILPLTLQLIGLNYSWPPDLVFRVINGIAAGTAAGVAGFAGFRLALKISYDDKSFPDWPVPKSSR